MITQMHVKGLMFDPYNNAYIVVLRDEEHSDMLPIWIGKSEARGTGLVGGRRQDLGSGDRVVVGVASDRAVVTLDALVVAADPVIPGATGRPGLPEMVAVGAADVVGTGDRIAQRCHAAREGRRSGCRHRGEQPYHEPGGQ